MNLTKLPTPLVIGAVVAFIAVLAAYVVLALTGHADAAGGIVPTVATLLGLLGLGAHTTNRLSQQDEQLDTISHQTNGVLTARIEAGADKAMRQVLRDAGYNVPDAPDAQPAVEGSGQ